ncbi:COP9 signalosome complex subunit 3 [Dendrobium catenatum]|nr:COP9 signalosome complex subunit 3 [Dendrobium catenatum]
MRVLQMIQDGDIFATINQKDGMVSFHEDPEQYKTCEMIDQIDSSIQRLMALSKKLTAIDEHISCDPAYITKIGRERPRLDFDDFDSVPHKFL